MDEEIDSTLYEFCRSAFQACKWSHVWSVFLQDLFISIHSLGFEWISYNLPNVADVNHHLEECIFWRGLFIV